MAFGQWPHVEDELSGFSHRCNKEVKRNGTAVLAYQSVEEVQAPVGPSCLHAKTQTAMSDAHLCATDGHRGAER